MAKPLSNEDIEQRRDELVAAALTILEVDGITGLTLRRLAEGTGVSRQTPYLYFKDKAALVDAMCVAGIRQLTASSSQAVLEASAKGPIEQLRMAGETYVRFGLQNPNLYALIFNPAKINAKPSDAMAEAVAENNAVSRSLMQRAWDEGRISMEPERLNNVFWAALHGLISLRHDGLICDDETFFQVLADLEQTLAVGFLNDG
ncbi:MAG: TetR/AcrR family transcriptional regulator [Alphaproteobacteria bacterium]|nr:TetR/AcrR family transcriptional regulator [Alphaproteobacteria bacterium]